MSKMSREAVLDRVTSFFLQSKDFNGIPASVLVDELEGDWTELREILGSLIQHDVVGVIFADTGINAHIIQTHFEATDEQIQKIETDSLQQSCVYPLQRHLEGVVDKSIRPRTLQALSCVGRTAAQLPLLRSIGLRVLSQ